jgi:multisubunit Na+/H+ antiporter MnhE subunit
MALQFVLNVLLAFVWMFLNNSWTMPHFVAGFLIGMLFIALLSRFWPHDFYLKRFWLVLKLLAIFVRELRLFVPIWRCGRASSPSRRNLRQAGKLPFYPA